jgi:hypothetical protein
MLATYLPEDVFGMMNHQHNDIEVREITPIHLIISSVFNKPEFYINVVRLVRG